MLVEEKSITFNTVERIYVFTPSAIQMWNKQTIDYSCFRNLLESETRCASGTSVDTRISTTVKCLSFHTCVVFEEEVEFTSTASLIVFVIGTVGYSCHDRITRSSSEIHVLITISAGVFILVVNTAIDASWVVNALFLVREIEPILTFNAEVVNHTVSFAVNSCDLSCNAFVLCEEILVLALETTK